MPREHEFLDQVHAVARRHGVPADQVREVPGGVANRAFALGHDLFLRIARPGYESDLHKETSVIPTVRLLGVQTPAILEYDNTRHILPTPYVVMPRIHGTEPITLPTALPHQLATLHHLHLPPQPPATHTPTMDSDAHPAKVTTRPAEAGAGTAESNAGTAEVAAGTAGATGRTAESGARTAEAGASTADSGTTTAEVAAGTAGAAARAAEVAAGTAEFGAGSADAGVVGRDVREVLAGVPEDGWGDPWATVEGLVEQGYLDPGTAGWVRGWFDRLAERIDWNQPRVLIHGDVATHNLLADADNNLLALIDWGDATWAPRAMDFAKLPLTQAAQILPTYLHHTHSQPRPLLPQTSPPTTTSPTRTTTPDTAAPTETAGPARTTGTAARAGTAGTAGRAETEGGAGAAGHVSSAIGGPATAAAEELAAGVLWFHLSWALAKLPASPWPDQRHWTAPTASRLVNLLHFFTTNPPAPWSALV